MSVAIMPSQMMFIYCICWCQPLHGIWKVLQETVFIFYGCYGPSRSSTEYSANSCLQTTLVHRTLHRMSDVYHITISPSFKCYIVMICAQLDAPSFRMFVQNRNSSSVFRQAIISQHVRPLTVRSLLEFAFLCQVSLLHSLEE